jgi:6-pyruvoyltetrahydropterin/6-carboxytetrahydropterin synthase
MDSYITIDGWKSNIKFSSAHIIPEYEKCGRLHGHSYAVHIKLYGKPDDNGIIMDFSRVKDVLLKIVNELDHKVIIPEKNNTVKIERKSDNVRVTLLGKKYVFPLSDCIFLPIRSTSAENLASYISDRFVENISLPKRIEYIEIGVDEGFGQGARISRKM